MSETPELSVDKALKDETLADRALAKFLSNGSTPAPRDGDGLGWAELWAREANDLVRRGDYMNPEGAERLKAMIAIGTLQARVAEVRLQADVTSGADWS